jgi:glyoxylate utilization-related uncharacterized protein
MDKRSKAQLDVRPVADGISKMTFAGASTDLTWTMTEPGREHARPPRPFEQVLYMVSGRMRLTVAGEETVMDAAEMVVIPPHAEAASVTLDEAAVDLTVRQS